MATRGRPRHVSADLVAEAATELFLEQGYHHTSVDDIAQRSGIARATFFTLFPAKVDVLFHDIDTLLDDISRRIDEGKVPLEAVMDATAGVTRARLPLIATHADAMSVVPDIRSVGPARYERLRTLVEVQFPEPFSNWVVTAAIASAALSWASGAEEGSLSEAIQDAIGRLGALVEDAPRAMH